MAASEKQVFIVGACRTPIGNLNGSLSTFPAAQLGSTAIKEALERANVPADKVSEVIMGQTLTAGQGQNPARQAAMKAGIPKEVPSTSVNMLCGSGKILDGTDTVNLQFFLLLMAIVVIAYPFF